MCDVAVWAVTQCSSQRRCPVTLHVLSRTGCKVQAEGAAALGEAWASCSELRDVNLRGTALVDWLQYTLLSNVQRRGGRENACRAPPVVLSDTTFVAWCVPDCEVGDEGAIALAKGWMHCPHLRVGNLQGGACSVACISLLKCSNSIPSNLLNTHTPCARHCLTDCGVGPAGATALAGAWKHCTELEEVNFARTVGSQQTTCYTGGL